VKNIADQYELGVDKPASKVIPGVIQGLPTRCSPNKGPTKKPRSPRRGRLEHIDEVEDRELHAHLVAHMNSLLANKWQIDRELRETSLNLQAVEKRMNDRIHE